MNRARLHVFGALAILAALAVLAAISPARALAQQPGQPPQLPMAVDLKKAPVGVWAEYNMTIGQVPPMKARMALVAKNAQTNTLEMIMEGGMLSMAGGKLVMQTVIDADQDKENPVKRVTMQIAENDPMEMPLDSKQQKQFHKPNPKSLVKEETIKVAAGSFKTKHYRDKTPGGDTFDFWVSQDVPPFGIVKVDTDQTHPLAGTQGPVRFELTALGKNAKMTVTKPAKPFDQAQLISQLMAGATKGTGGLVPLETPKPSSSPSSSSPAKH
jgi:hypothetical protein